MDVARRGARLRTAKPGQELHGRPRHCWLVLSGLAATLALALLAGCTESDEGVFEEIGVLRLFVVDPGLSRQTLHSRTDAIQVARWTIEQALVTLDGRQVSLLGGEPCTILDTVGSLPLIEGPCSGGVVIGSSDEPILLTLDLVLQLELRREDPLSFRTSPRPPLDADSDIGEDGLPAPDGIRNFEDNCPLVPNPPEDCDEDPQTPPAQCDEDTDGTGDVCEVFSREFGVDLRDSDGDGVADVFDNCLFLPNVPADCDRVATTPPVQCDEDADGIGDVCAQSAVVNLKGDTQIEIDAELVLVQGQDQVTFLTVAFDHSGIACDWSAGVCTIPPESIEVCLNESLGAASFGCLLAE